MSLKACRECKTITEENLCPNCKKTDLSEDFEGLLIIIDPEESQIARRMNISKEGRYALKIR
ncbi:MAG: transcription elongation factor subunit Spt4 [Candidatus Bathyarchaeia archaeon]